MGVLFTSKPFHKNKIVATKSIHLRLKVDFEFARIGIIVSWRHNAEWVEG